MRVIGEFQHAPQDTKLTALGEVLLGRSGDDEVMAFDSSRLSLQDLSIGRALLAKHRNGRTK